MKTIDYEISRFGKSFVQVVYEISGFGKSFVEVVLWDLCFWIVLIKLVELVLIKLAELVVELFCAKICSRTCYKWY